MNAPFDMPRAAKAVAWCSETADLTAIFDDTVQISVLPRLPDGAIASYLGEAVKTGLLGGGFRTVLQPGQRPDLRELPAIPDQPGRDALAADLAGLAELYGDLLGCDAVGLRLEVIERAMCPRFHIDRVGIRMLCTYRGPGTEWLDEDCADRRFLGSRSGGLPDDLSGLIHNPSGIQAVPPFAIALLKGELWQGNTGRGIIHRSPALPVDDSPRVLVALDAVWD